jgi:RNA polymerase sigma factor (sigma-70 family)
MDMAAWARLMSPDNRENLDELRKNLRIALCEDVTPRQREFLLLYYGEGINMTEIGKRVGVHHATVARTIRRGEARLRRCLRYGAANLLSRD